MDTDIIITNGDFLKKLENYELVMLGEDKNNIQNIGFIFASKYSTLLNDWLEKIIDKITIYKEMNSKTTKTRKKVKWDYLGNSIIDDLVKNITGKKYFRLDRKKINAFPELKYFERSPLTKRQKYKRFYFQKGSAEKVLKEAKGIIYLHNSWTPLKYKKLSEKEFLEKNILLSKLLDNILNKS